MTTLLAIACSAFATALTPSPTMAGFGSELEAALDIEAAKDENASALHSDDALPASLVPS